VTALCQERGGEFEIEFEIEWSGNGGNVENGGEEVE